MLVYENIFQNLQVFRLTQHKRDLAKFLKHTDTEQEAHISISHNNQSTLCYMEIVNCNPILCLYRLQNV